MKNDYGQLVEKWKAELILKRATRAGFRADELEDVQQDIIQAVLNFEFVSHKSNGAKERTALTALIDKQLAFIYRRETRRTAAAPAVGQLPREGDCLWLRRLARSRGRCDARAGQALH